MSIDHVEIEDKYDVPADLEMPALDGLPGVSRVSEPVQHRLVAAYFDTPDHALLAAKVTLRRRTGGDDAGWHLKLPAGDARHEVSAQLGSSEHTVPRRLRRMLFGIVRRRKVAEVVRLETDRTVRRLLADDGRALAEVADDRVTARVGADSQPVRWREWEIELVDGDRELLAAAADLMRAGGALPAPWPSKLAHALDRGRGHKPSSGGGGEPGNGAGKEAATRNSAASVLVQARLAEQVEELRWRDPLVRGDVDDAVHKMRVATRRLRSALATYRPMLDRRITEPLRAELTWLTGELGDARDAEVMRDRLLTMLDDEPRASVRGRVRSRVRRDLTRRYRAAHDECLRAMRSPRYTELVDSLQQLAISPPFSPKASRSVDDVVRKRVRHEWKRLRHRVDAVSPEDPPYLRARRLHEIRKAAKRLRYAGEPMVSVYGDDAADLVSLVEQIQGILGDHHDSVVMRPQLRRLGDEAAAEGDNGFTFGLLHAREEEIAAKREAEFADAWSELRRKRHRRWLEH